MGRYAQQKKRGGHLGGDAVLPPGPVNGKWSVQNEAGLVWAYWIDDGPAAPGYWRSRWRIPSLSMSWTLGTPAATDCMDGEEQASPFPGVHLQQQDVESIYCDAGGNPKSQWSGYQSIVP